MVSTVPRESMVAEVPKYPRFPSSWCPRFLESLWFLQCLDVQGSLVPLVSTVPRESMVPGVMPRFPGSYGVHGS